MSILKFVHSTPRALTDMYAYLTDINKTDYEHIFGIGVNPRHAVEEMTYVHNLYRRKHLLHQYKQVIFSFDKGLSIDDSLLKIICMDIGKILLFDDRQIIAAIHYKNTNHIHCHYLINYLSIQGEYYRQKQSVYAYKIMINQLLMKYNIPNIYYYGIENTQIA